ncbi:MAG: HD domain-containing protein [Rhodobacteraceae bacterium]|nr:HD domain-containing protein [Paracoccaceae bacterium]
MAVEHTESSPPFADAGTLIRRVAEYQPDCDRDLIAKAYRFAETKHAGQTRDSGEPYFSHPVGVAEILIEHHYSDEFIITALLHDTIEDCADVDVALIRTEFGSEIASLVQSVTKVSTDTKKPGFDLWLRTDEPPSNPVKKDFRDIVRILYASARDGRAVAVKLADRLHNMKTIHSCAPEKQRRIAIETLTIYAPLARSLGMHYWRKELENKAFKTLLPDQWSEMRRLYARVRGPKSGRSLSYLTAHRIEEDLRTLMSRHGFDTTIKARVKEPYSVWRKMEEQSITEGHQDWLLDAYGYQVIIRSHADEAKTEKKLRKCREKALAEVYRALCVVHGKWKTVPGRFKDYISSPKANGYRSIHTTVAIEGTGHAEVQIRTDEMHQEAEHGLAAHWTYRHHFPANSKTRAIPEKWMQDIQHDLIEDVVKCEEHIKKQIEDSIVCFNERGNTVRLPIGATALDMAYLDPTGAGGYAGRAKIDLEIKNLSTELKHGQLVQIRKHHQMRVDKIWLNMTNSEEVRRRILHDLAMQELEAEFGPEHPVTQDVLAKAAAAMQFRDVEEMVERLGESLFGQQIPVIGSPGHLEQEHVDHLAPAYQPYPGVTANDILRHALPEEHKIRKLELRRRTTATDIEIDGGGNPKIARCCMPIPGEMVVGLLGEDGEAILHAIDCCSLSRKSARAMKWKDVVWRSGSESFLAGFTVRLRNTVGALGMICQVIGKQNTNISDLIFLSRNYSEFDIFFEVQVSNREHLANIMDAVAGQTFASMVVRCRNLDDVKRQHRTEASGAQHAVHWKRKVVERV